MTFVPDEFEPPLGLSGPGFELEPLGPQHNDSDYEAWSSSIDFIHTLHGFVGTNWPRPMTLEENLGDLEGHAADFAARKGFTYTVREPGEGPVIGCVYIYPPKEGDAVRVSSWVTERRAELDEPLREAVRAWLARDWPFTKIDY